MQLRDEIGPLYCERLMNAGLAEPINFFTNTFAVALGIYLIYYFSKQQKNTKQVFIFGIYAAALLTITGIGSFLWHGYRTPLFLAMDTIPGVLLLLSLIFYFYYRTFSLKFSAAYLLTLFIVLSLTSSVLIKINPLLFFLLMFSLVAITCAFLIFTHYMNKINIKYISIGFVLALIAAIFRSIDLPVCESIPTGTHFLWHIFLPLAAYFTILHAEVLYKIKKL